MGSPGHTHPATSQGRRRGSTPRQRPHASDHGFRGKREPARGSETHRDCFTDLHHRDRKLRGQQPGADAILGTAMPRPRLPFSGPSPRGPGGHVTWRGRGAVTWTGPPSAPRMRQSSPTRSPTRPRLGPPCRVAKDDGIPSACPSAATEAVPYAIIQSIRWDLFQRGNWGSRNNKSVLAICFCSEAKFKTFTKELHT
ncbi:unnamed protein product [Rangifer tarandus platyrhynchus]|uniref:Uncharacterized protein n=1 Tax=Rangifer tarandus platyrhynchus TaxID=3082113 RepID=A0ABN8Y7M3_RANTA|nr:unnamed protein product [Rangifer tarandus platyrhynchus]